MVSTAETALSDWFSAGTDEFPADVMTELVSIMRLHELSAEDLFYKWEAYCIRMDWASTDLTMTSVRAFKRDIQDGLDRVRRSEKRVGATPRAAAATARTHAVLDMFDGLVPRTPGSAKMSRTPGTGPDSLRKRIYETPTVARTTVDVPSSSPDVARQTGENSRDLSNRPTTTFEDRLKPGEIVEILNDHLPSTGQPPPAPYSHARIKLTAASDQKKMTYRPLAMKLSEASETLDDRIDEFANLVQVHHSLDDSSFGNPAAQKTTPVVAVGRIASDSPSGGRLNPASIVLETSRRGGGGLRVPLNLSRLTGCAVFPGQVVAVRGINSSGAEFVVEEMLDLPLMPSAASTPSALVAHRDRMRGNGGSDANPDAMDLDPDASSTDPTPLIVYFASGPYTADDNLDFEPLHELCAQAADALVDALVLTGPFLDVDHPLIASGDFDLPKDAGHDSDTATLATVFRYLITPALSRVASANPAVSIVLVPSVRDAVAKHVSWPQDAIPRKDLGLPRCARVVTNPMTLSLNEAVLAISTQDVLFELRTDELVVGRPAAASAAALLPRLCRHLIEQRHYFPLFPPADRQRLPGTGTEDGVAVGAMFDPSYLKLGEIVNVRPDILLIPSALPPFAKVIESVVVINPGFLSRRKAPGTYAKMTLHAPQGDAGGDPHQAHKVFQRARVEIVRI